MRRVITKELAEKIRSKLCGEDPPKITGGHDVYVVRFNGRIVADVAIRRGSEKDKGHDHIPPALNIGPHFAKEIGICNKGLDDYLDSLRSRNLLPADPEVPERPELKRPWERDWVALQESSEPEPPEGESNL
jgi:hypothetical protein